MSFWNDLLERSDNPAVRERRGLRKPIIGLAPMDGVTDATMRYMTAKYGRPDVLFTEFVSVDALHYASGERRERLLKTFAKAREVGELEHQPFEIAQVFGNKSELFREAAVLIEQLGFDGIDINMGCPAHKVEENGSGAGLIRTPELAQEIIRAVKGVTKLPVSIKTRIGVESEVVEAWMGQVMEAKPEMISLHGRTLKQLYQGEADWEAIGRAAGIVHSLGGHILGNGDVQSIEDGQKKVSQYSLDGFLIGRAAEGNPGVFAGNNQPSREQRLAWISEHAKIFEQIYKPDNQSNNDNRWFAPVRKHLAWYAHGFPGASELRTKLVMSNSREEVERIIGELN